MANRLRQMRVSKGLNQNEVGELVGMAQSAVSKWERGATEPDHNTLRILSDYYGVSIDYLLGNSDEPQAKRKGVSIPVLGDVAAGIPIDAVEDILDYEEIDEDLARTGEFFALRIRGQSMEPRMMEGDVVIVRQQETAESVAAFMKENGYTFPVYLDTEMDGAAAYGVSSIPRTIFIDGEGNVAADQTGTISGQRLRETVDAMLE